MTFQSEWKEDGCPKKTLLSIKLYCDTHSGCPLVQQPRDQTPILPTIRNKIKQGKKKLLKGFGLLNKKNPIQTQIRTLTKTQGFPAL